MSPNPGSDRSVELDEAAKARAKGELTPHALKRRHTAGKKGAAAARAGVARSDCPYAEATWQVKPLREAWLAAFDLEVMKP